MVSKLLKRFASWILEAELLDAELQLIEQTELRGYYREMATRQREQNRVFCVRTNEIRNWLAGRAPETNTERFMFTYILEGNEVANPDGNRWSATGGVHPAKRWGINDFMGRDFTHALRHGGCIL